ncbi:MAG: polymerase sigma factor, sigma-70 family [Clostridiales bacterium]|nr:polymerase sigma factor, sigma-70 family [Clostridiales bacterium]
MDYVQYPEQWISEELFLIKYSIYKTMLFRIAFSYLGNKHDCEDILQEAFIKLCYHSPDFQSDEDEKRWVVRITINLCKNHLKSFWRKKRIDTEELEAYAYESEDRDVLISIIQLSPKYKTVILLFYFEGYKISEIADIMKLSESAVKMRLKRGRELLKIELEES